jgi:hypothetical protein
MARAKARWSSVKLLSRAVSDGRPSGEEPSIDFVFMPLRGPFSTGVLRACRWSENEY